MITWCLHLLQLDFLKSTQIPKIHPLPSPVCANSVEVCWPFFFVRCHGNVYIVLYLMLYLPCGKDHACTIYPLDPEYFEASFLGWEYNKELLDWISLHYLSDLFLDNLHLCYLLRAESIGGWLASNYKRSLLNFLTIHLYVPMATLIECTDYLSIQFSHSTRYNLRSLLLIASLYDHPS